MNAKEEYLKFISHLDIVLEVLSKSNESISLKGILINNKIDSSKEYVYEIGNKLYEDQYVKMNRDSGGTDLKITPAGLEFIVNGGYKGNIKSNEEKEKNEKELIESTIKSNKINIKLFRWNIGFAVLNLILFIVNLIIAYFTLIKK